MAFDLDDGEKNYNDVTRKLREDKVAFLGYSSFNHMRAKDGAAPVEKFRIIVFITAPCQLYDADQHECALRVSSYKRAYLAVGAHYGLRVDKTCCNPARFFYSPAHDGSVVASKHAFIDVDGYDTGTPLDFDTFVAVARAAVIAEYEASEKRKEARAAKRAKKQERRAAYETVGLDRFVQDCGAGRIMRTAIFCA